MKQIKINFKPLLGLVIFFTLILLLLMNFQFDHVNEKIKIYKTGEEYPSINTKETKLEFVPDRDDVSGIVLNIDKRTFMPGEEKPDLLLNIIYADRHNPSKIYDLKYSYPMKRLALGGVQTLKFEPLKNSNGQKITILMRSSGEVPVVDGIKIHALQYKVLYHEVLRDVVAQSTFDLGFDRPFQIGYYSLLGLVLAVALILFCFRVEDKKLIKNEKQ